MEYILHTLNTRVVDPYLLGVTHASEPPLTWASLRADGVVASFVPAAAHATMSNRSTMSMWAGGASGRLLSDAPFGAPYDPQYGVLRQLAVLTVFLYLGAVALYVLMACTTFTCYFREDASKAEQRGDVKEKDGSYSRPNMAWWRRDGAQIRAEIFTSLWSLFIMAGMTAPLELLMMNGYGQVYHSIDDYGMAYFILSPFLFIIFTDSLIYWIHRGLHWGPVYKLHKLHHRFKETTPFSAFSFHPIDGWAQGLPYHLFVLFFPMHSILYTISVALVGLWTINIHDRVTLNLWGVNGAAHHTVHHTKFNYNYGQYFTFWDRVCGTYMDPSEHAPYNRPPYVVAAKPAALVADPNDENGSRDPNDADKSTETKSD